MIDILEIITEYKKDNLEKIEDYREDCSELAESLVLFLKEREIKSHLLRIETVDYNFRTTDLWIKDGDKLTDYSYHYVVLVGSYVVDLRRNDPIVNYDEYKKEVEQNNNKKIIFKEEYL